LQNEPVRELLEGREIVSACVKEVIEEQLAIVLSRDPPPRETLDDVEGDIDAPFPGQDGEPRPATGAHAVADEPILGYQESLEPEEQPVRVQSPTVLRSAGHDWPCAGRQRIDAVCAAARLAGIKDEDED
jgi:hypothetical protein